MLRLTYERSLGPLLRIYFYPVVLMLFLFISLYGCSVKYAGPEVLDDGVRFSIKAPNAQAVTIAGSFNHWDIKKDVLSGPDEEGVWSITLPLAEGRHEYLFVIDGEKWMPDPGVPFADDGMGGRNSVFVLRKP